jgi:hypothetical protein
MPTVPSPTGPTIAGQPLRGEAAIARATLQALRERDVAFGGAAAFGPVAEQLRGLGQDIQEIAIDQRNEANKIKMLQVESDYLTLAERRLHDPQNGLITWRGEKALAVPSEIDRIYAEFEEQQRATLFTDEQRMAFTEMSMQHRDRANRWGNTHASREIAMFKQEKRNSSREQISDTIASDDSTWDWGWERILKITLDEAADNGWSKEKTLQEISKWASRNHLKVIQRKIDEGFTKEAREYYDSLTVGAQADIEIDPATMEPGKFYKRFALDPNASSVAHRLLKQGEEQEKEKNMRVRVQQWADAQMREEMTPAERRADARARFEGDEERMALDEINTRISELDEREKRTQEDTFGKVYNLWEADKTRTPREHATAKEWRDILTPRQRLTLEEIHRTSLTPRITDDKMWFDWLFMSQKEKAALKPSEYWAMRVLASDDDRRRMDTELRIARAANTDPKASENYQSGWSDRFMLMDALAFYKHGGISKEDSLESIRADKSDAGERKRSAIKRFNQQWEEMRQKFHTDTGQNPDDKDKLRMLRRILKPTIKVQRDDETVRFGQLESPVLDQFRVPFENIPPWDINRLRDFLGEKFTEERVEDLYEIQLLNESGYLSDEVAEVEKARILGSTPTLPRSD